MTIIFYWKNPGGTLIATLDELGNFILQNICGYNPPHGVGRQENNYNLTDVAEATKKFLYKNVSATNIMAITWGTLVDGANNHKCPVILVKGTITINDGANIDGRTGVFYWKNASGYKTMVLTSTGNLYIKGTCNGAVIPNSTYYNIQCY